jgi:hypothetical protein
VVDENGNPIEVYHGTTHGFDEFSKERSNIENDMGAGFYFTTSRDDADQNYDSLEGADLKNRIEQLTERLESNLEIPYEQAREKAISRLAGDNYRILPLYLSVKNPVYIGGDNDTVFDYSFDEETSEEGGLIVEFFENFRWAAAGFHDVEPDRLFEGIEIEYEMGAADFIKAIKSNEAVLYATDDDGNLAGNEIIRKALELMGFDGIIDSTVSRFNMDGIFAGTQHIIAFNPTQIKSVDAKSFCHESNINLDELERVTREVVGI